MGGGDKHLHQCVNYKKKKLSQRHPLPTFGSFSFFQASILLWVDKVLQKLTKSYRSELKHLFQCRILILMKCLRKNPILTHSRGQAPQILADQFTLFKPEGRLYPLPITLLLVLPLRFSDLPAAKLLWSMVLLSNMANQVKNPFKCHNYTIHVKKNGFCIDDFVEFCRVTERKNSLQGKTF